MEVTFKGARKMHCMLMDLLHGFEVLSTTEETLLHFFDFFFFFF